MVNIFAADARRGYYDNAIELNQAVLDAALAGMENQIQFIVDISLPGGDFLRLSDQPLYVGNRFYEGRIKIPKVERKISELLAASLTFSEIQVDINNVDGAYNRYLVGGANYTPFFGQSIELKAGLRDVESSYFTVFKGFVHYEGSVERGSKTFTLRARDQFETLNKPIPLPLINLTDFPLAPQDSLGKRIPMALGDWTYGFNFNNAADVDVGSEIKVKAKTAAGNFGGGLLGYFVGAGVFVFSIGSYLPDTILSVLVKRGDNYLVANFTASPTAAAGYWCAQVLSLIKTDNSSTGYIYQSGDVAAISVKVPYAVGQYDNAVDQAREVLKTLAGVAVGDFDATSWNTLRAKTSPASGAVANIKSRLWIGEANSGDATVLSAAISLLKQIRADIFIDRNRRVKLLSLALEDNPQLSAVPAVTQYNVLEGTFKPQTDRRNFFNSAAGNYSFNPITGKTAFQTAKRKNSNSIFKSGKEIAKAIDFPNLYIPADVQNQVDEYVRFYSAGLEYVSTTLTWNHIIRDLGDFVTVSFNVGSVSFDRVPMMIRNLSASPESGSVEVLLLSFANLPYPNFSPNYQAQMLSSFNQTIS